MLKVMTLNIRYGSAEDGINQWENRKSLVIDRIKAFAPDLLGMQECRDDRQAEFIKSNLRDYEFYGIRREGGGDTALEMAPILFKRSAFELTQRGYFWLSETSQVPGSKSWGSTFPRTAAWVQLTHKISGKEIIFLNTHFDYEPSAMDGSAQVLQKWLAPAIIKYPVIVTGDFNADKNSPAFRQLTEKTSLIDAYNQTHPSNGNDGTFHRFGQADTSWPIDWILVSDSLAVLSAEIDRYHEGGLYPSDHYPLVAAVNL